MGTLSGGNQQKVAVGKWLGTEPRVMLLEEPTRGVDIGARAEIYQRLRDLCAAGLGIVVSSSDTAEILGLSDTIATFYRGRLTGIRPQSEWTEDALVREVMHQEAGRVSEPAQGAASMAGGAPASLGNGRRPDWLPFAILVALAAAAVLAAVLLTPSFLTVDNIRAILRNASIVGIVAVGMTPVTLSGNFVSLGITQSAMLAMVSFVAMLGAGWGQAPAILAVIALLVGVGIVQGVIIAVGLNPVITTLAAGAIIFGVVSELSGGGIVRAGDNGVSWGGSTVAGHPDRGPGLPRLHRRLPASSCSGP